jgi:hypothetical protein
VKKGLWVTNTSNRARLLAKAQLMDATSVAVRTDNEWLLDSIAEFHAAGIEVYGWRWRSARPGSAKGPRSRRRR